MCQFTDLLRKFEDLKLQYKMESSMEQKKSGAKSKLPQRDQRHIIRLATLKKKNKKIYAAENYSNLP